MSGESKDIVTIFILLQDNHNNITENPHDGNVGARKHMNEMRFVERRQR
jgi:hypothetical protein